MFVNYTCITLMSNPSLSMRCGRRAIKEGSNIVNRDMVTLLLIEALSIDKNVQRPHDNRTKTG